MTSGMTSVQPAGHRPAPLRHGSEPFRHTIRDVPRLTVSKRLRRPPPKHDPGKEYQFRYRARKHGSLPHVVKFSGGRSSGMLLFALLENGLLDASRGDVIVFNKGAANLGAIHAGLEDAPDTDVPGFGPLADTPSDLRWWMRIEALYGRDLHAEKRTVRTDATHIGFFGNHSFVYKDLATGRDLGALS